MSIADVNGEPGVVVSEGERIVSVISLQVRDGRIHHIHGVGNPAKLAHLVPPPAPEGGRTVLSPGD